MRLADLTKQIPIASIGSDRELASDIQGQLQVLGLLDPPVDRQFGPVSEWALQAFCELHGLAVSDQLSPTVAAKLAAVDAAAAGKIVEGKNDLAAKIVGALMRRGYWIARHPKCCNIVYVEGMDPDGTVNNNAPNIFNDSRILLKIDDSGTPVIDAAYDGTTEPGRYYEDNPETPLGTARIAFAQYKSWIVGTHHPGSPGAHEALIQVADVTVCRDLNKDNKRDGDKRFTGLFGINQHWGFDFPRSDVGRSSAGCLVGRAKDGHRDFMHRVKADPRFKANKAYRFMTTVLPAAAIDEKSFDPTSPH